MLNIWIFIIRLDGAEILKICRILCLRATTNSRKRRIMKVMEYLKKPFNPLKIKGKGSFIISFIIIIFLNINGILAI